MTRESAQQPDPTFVLGIALSGAGAALSATIGPIMLAMLAVGVLLMAVGISRDRRRRASPPA